LKHTHTNTHTHTHTHTHRVKAHFVMQVPYFPPYQSIEDFSDEWCVKMVGKLVGKPEKVAGNTCIHTHTHTHTHIHTHTYTHTHTHIPTYTNAHTHTHTHIHTHTHTGRITLLSKQTVVTLLLHCCYPVVTLLLHCCYTAVTLLLHCCFTVVTLLLHCAGRITLLSKQTWSMGAANASTYHHVLKTEVGGDADASGGPSAGGDDAEAIPRLFLGK
jgi:hypothetical protein